MEGSQIFTQQSSTFQVPVPVPVSQPFGRKRPSILTFDSQMGILNSERKKAREHLETLNELQQTQHVPVTDLLVDLWPAINNQRRANVSLERAVRRVIKKHRLSLPTQQVCPTQPEPSAAAATNEDAEGRDEVDLVQAPTPELSAANGGNNVGFVQ